jgi:hypothetical protein
MVFLISLVSVISAASADPARSQGISMHMLPKGVADLGRMKWGFSVDYSKLLKPEPEQPVLQTPEEFIGFVRKQDKAVQDNGVWIVTTHPDAYSTVEAKLLEDIGSLCRRQGIPLFISRASALPNGWKRYDQ